MIFADLEEACDRVMDAERALDDARRAREVIIIKAHADGLSLRTIAGVAGVSHQTVANVVAARAATTTSQPAPPTE
jgi:transposase